MGNGGGTEAWSRSFRSGVQCVSALPCGSNPVFTPNIIFLPNIIIDYLPEQAQGDARGPGSPGGQAGRMGRPHRRAGGRSPHGLIAALARHVLHHLGARVKPLVLQAGGEDMVGVTGCAAAVWSVRRACAQRAPRRLASGAFRAGKHSTHVERALQGPDAALHVVHGCAGAHLRGCGGGVGRGAHQWAGGRSELAVGAEPCGDTAGFAGCALFQGAHHGDDEGQDLASGEQLVQLQQGRRGTQGGAGGRWAGGGGGGREQEPAEEQPLLSTACPSRSDTAGAQGRPRKCSVTGLGARTSGRPALELAGMRQPSCYCDKASQRKNWTSRPLQAPQGPAHTAIFEELDWRWGPARVTSCEGAATLRGVARAWGCRQLVSSRPAGGHVAARSPASRSCIFIDRLYEERG